MGKVLTFEDRKDLQALIAELKSFPGRKRHWLSQFQDAKGSIGQDFGNLDLNVRSMVDRLEDLLQRG